MKLSDKISLLCDLVTLRLRPLPRGERSGSLLIRLDRIGDFLLFAPFIPAFCPPGEHCIMLANKLWAACCQKLFPKLQVIPVDPGEFLREPRLRRHLLDLVSSLLPARVYQARFYRELLVEELLYAASGTRDCRRFAATPLHLQHNLLKLLAPAARAELSFLPGEHELERNARFAEFCAPGVRAENPWSARPFAPAELPAKEYFCVFPGSGKGPSCCWPAEKWGELLVKMDLPHCVITGTPAERGLLETIASFLPEKRVTVLSDLTVEEFIGTVSRAKGALGVDTGGIHAAAMSGVPSVVLAGRGQPGWFLPYPEHCPVPGVVPPVVVSCDMPCENCFWRCRNLVGGICRCIAEITPDQVLEVVGKSSFSAFL